MKTTYLDSENQMFNTVIGKGVSAKSINLNKLGIK